MKSFMQKMALAGLFALAAGSAGATVTVTYVQPDRFSDVPFVTADREDTLKTLTDHFTWLGSSLPPGQDLRIEVLDIDLAGRLIPNARMGRDLRVLRGQADWPRIDLRYSLEQNGQVLKSGEAQLSDMNYLNHTNRYFDGEPLRYEKAMIDDWFEKTIGPLPRNRR
ncbi:hypothetical protein AB595_19045 [Massilia sp. WF1]|uniref:DUF3016 domain-containing protein n=1 Tax=unclassified Massilia TaxID=2609279 RepID=UPI0006493621|nr:MULTISPECIES: DUF3016 domain-containing protein [unclassified Massilia]ALK95579.1 hypothetical protein AM586_03985 [Massilia sp. WG5]KLU35241.1 hypothetical protein AB595_19045 [Massilia sp. WF1]